MNIPSLHKTLCLALGLPVLRLSISGESQWYWFVRETCLDSTPGGPLTCEDIQNVIALMRKQKTVGTGWSLRYSRIMRDPETFRDLVLETRRQPRPRPPVVRITREQPDGCRVLAEKDTAMEAVAVAAHEEFLRFCKEMGRTI